MKMVCIHVLIGALESMRLETCALQHYREALGSALKNPSVSGVVLGTGQLLKAVDAFESAIGGLLSLVTEEREAGAGQRAMRSLAELTLYCRTAGILSQVEQLVGALSEPHAHRPDMFTPELGTMAAVAARFCDAIASGTRNGSTGHRPTGPSLHDTAESTWRDGAAVRAGQHAIARLGTDPGIVHFLHKGMERTDDPAISGPCTNIAALLEMSFPVEPDPAIFGAAADPRLARDQCPSGTAGIPGTEGPR